MDTKEQYSAENLIRFAEVVPSPVIVCNADKEIVGYNVKASEFFALSGDGFSVFQLFQPADQVKVNQIFAESAKNRRALEEILPMKASGDVYVRGRVNIKEFSKDFSEVYFVISFIPIGFGDQNSDVRVSVNTEHLSDVLKNKKLLQIIDDIHSNYPFTFIGRNKIQQEINKLEELFWIKDVNDTYVLVNKKFSDSLGLRPQQLEGRNEKNFLPIYFLEFYRSLENYIKDTLNSLTIEGIPFRGFASWNSFQTIEVPLCDNESNVIAIIGISQKKQSKTARQAEEHSGQSDLRLIEKLPHPVAVFNRQEELLGASRSFTKSFSAVSRKNAHLSEFFDDISYEQFHNFLESEQTTTRFEIELSFKKDESSLFSLELHKITHGADEWTEFVLSLEKILNYDSLEDLIKQKGSMFDTLIQYNPEPIFIYDAENLRFLEVNDAALQLYGYRRDEFLQMDLTDLYSPEDIQSLLDSSPAKEKTPKFQGPFKHRKKDGSSILVQIAKSQFEFENREAHFNIIKNISDELVRNVDLEVFKTIYENTSDAVLITDSTGFIKDANTAAEQQFGISRDLLINSSIIEYVADDDRRALNTSVFYSHVVNPLQIEVSFSNKDGLEVPCSVRAVPILGADNQVESFNIIISPIHAPETIVKEVVKEVEVIKEVEKIKEVVVNSGSSESNARGIDASQIATIFHEILTPINVILGFVQELKESIGRPDKEQAEAIEYIDQNRENLLDIMNSISEFAQIKSAPDELIPEEIGVSLLIDENLQEEKEAAGNLGKELMAGRISSSLSIYSDKSKLKGFISQVIKIISRITDESTVYISSQQYDDDFFIITFRDNYSRISDKLITNFEGFYGGKSQISPKNFHLSRYNFASIKELQRILRSEYEVVMRSAKPYEIGFKFPMNLFEERPVIADDFLMKAEPVTEPIHEYHRHAAYDPSSTREIVSDPLYNNFTREIPPKPPVYSEPVVPAAKLPVQTTDDFEERTNQFSDEDFVIPIEERFSFQSSVAAPQNAAQPAPRKETTAYRSLDFTEPVEQPIVQKAPVQPPVTAAPQVEVQATPQFNYSPVQEPQFAVPTPSQMNEPQALSLSDLSCLYIEDQVDSQILFKVQMKELREIKFAVSFEEALPLLTAHNFDFIVMDINLQGEYNGLDALKMIHQMPQFQNLPIIAVTAYVLPGDKDKFILAGFNDFISKPIFREKMIDALEKIFHKKVNA